MSISGIRTFLYWLARLLGDIRAVETGRIPRRLVRRVAGKVTGRLLGRLFRGVVLALLVAAPGWAGETERSLESVTGLPPDGGRVRVEGRRLDIFDKQSRRVGYGVRRSDGSWDVFNLDGTRRATIQPSIGGQPAWRMVPRDRR